ncbi:hypothetical protein MLD38_034711 [Melastoma candidum]|uniref:Uncharacterized protein n=1 Tax=Melastoma candidum TaxID=119954 RepID=A0ACB9MAE9_9MYRT|nr:hypothetical protein MLD38_034711 [Melastoma candidum]
MENGGARKRKLKKEKGQKAEGEGVRGAPAIRKGGGDVFKLKDGGRSEKKKMKKKRRIVEETDAPDGPLLVGRGLLGVNDEGKESRRKKSNLRESNQALESNETEIDSATPCVGKSKGSKGRLEKAKRKKRTGLKISGEAALLKEKIVEPHEDEVHNMSSGAEDCSKGMKKWVSEYYQRRPGLKELQQRIDEFIVDHEAKLEQERKEREARAAEGGWTVVTHHKGRKKTTEAESGVVVGSVSQAATEEKMAKKKRKEVGLDFYRFQRKEAQRSELMMLQNKFEQDKKRIQELRATRKFRPF